MVASGFGSNKGTKYNGIIRISKMRIIFALIIALSVQSAIAQEKELLIIGTMHEVPTIVKHSYKPLLKYAKKYKPEAIFVEDIRPDDTLSLKNFTPRFLKLSLLSHFFISSSTYYTLVPVSL